jgi:tungstate transport system permease protein
VFLGSDDLSNLQQAFTEALHLIFTADAEIRTVVAASLSFSLSSTVLASLIGIPAGIALASSHMRFKRMIEDLLNTLLAMPTVVVGLVVYTLIFSQGPLGGFRLLFTPVAIILGQTLLIVPIVAALACGAVSMVYPVVRETAMTLGAGRLRTTVAVASEARAALLAACVTAFGRVIGEVGISLLLGGNILGYTRTITTAIALETSKGEFPLGLALGMILLCVAFAVNLAIRFLWGRKT